MTRLGFINTIKSASTSSGCGSPPETMRMSAWRVCGSATGFNAVIRSHSAKVATRNIVMTDEIMAGRQPLSRADFKRLSYCDATTVSNAVDDVL
jgi:hypothetical protein